MKKFAIVVGSIVVILLSVFVDFSLIRTTRNHRTNIEFVATGNSAKAKKLRNELAEVLERNLPANDWAMSIMEENHV